ncbi:MAG: efflux RND transporter permease subunit [Treponema sp.]|jgi:HAE1 family hydrophobic/amphiphilic exporter-1|nr:efflux RND transporter permease subunit [Treponema sp.]
MKISDYSIRHPAVITMCLVILLVFGIIAALNLKRSLITNMSLPTLIVITQWPGVGPEDIETEITNPLEETLGTLEGLKRMSSESRNSVSVIMLELGYDETTAAKIPDIREKIIRAMDNLPPELPSPPEILEYSTSNLPIMTILVEGEGNRGELSGFCRDNVLPVLSRIAGVTNVTMNGDSRDVVEVTADIDRLKAVGLSVLDIARTLPAYNASLPGGDGVFQGYNYNFRTEGRFGSLEEIEEQVLAYRDGQYIHLKDVAEVAVREGRRNDYVISGGRDSLALSVTKQQNGDTIAISREARRVLADLEREYAGGISFVFLKDDSSNINLSMNSVISSAITGAILAIFILFVFLHNTNTTIIIGLAIPLSILFTLIGLWCIRAGLDLITLGGLTAAIGMVVDASIVVLENIQRHFDGGMDRRAAASLGAGEVGGAVVASTATTLASFFPLLFLSGLAGIILKNAAWTIIFALFSSLFVSIIVVPFLCGLFLKKEAKKTLGSRAGEKVEKGMEKLLALYRRLLILALSSRKSFLAGSLILLILSVLSFRLLGFEFLAQTDMAEIELAVETPAGYTLEMTREKVTQLEREIEKLVPELDSSYFVVGRSGHFDSGTDRNRAFGTLKLSRVRNRRTHVMDIVNRLQDEIPRRIPDLRTSFRNGGVSNLLSLATGGEGFVVNVFSNDMDNVIAAAERVRSYLRSDPNVTDTDTDVRFNQREMTARLVHRYLGTLGLSSYEVAMMNRIIFNGVELGAYYGGRDNIPIELASTLRDTEIRPDILYGITLNSDSGVQVSLANVAALETAEKMSTILHRNKSRSITVSATLRDPNVRETSRRFTALIEKRGLVPGVSWSIGGVTEEMLSSFRSLLVVLAVAIFLVYAVMAIQFERFTQPLLIMSSVPFTLIGISGGLLVFGSSLNIVSIMGIVALAGIVVNNAIVLIDYTNLLRDHYRMPLEEAILTGACSRLRPILMTTLTTLLGVFPLAVGMGEGSEIYAPLGRSIFGGLFSSTFITLFFIPVVYQILETRKEKRKKAAPDVSGDSNLTTDLTNRADKDDKLV